MKSVYIVAHQSKPNLGDILRKVSGALQANGIAASAEPWIIDALGGEDKKAFTDSGIGECEAILALGGDGTLLRANSIAVENDKPLLGINIGTVGFLTMVELEQADEAFRRLRRDEYTIDERMLLLAELQGQSWLALNDVVISRGGYSRLIGVNAWVGDEHVGRFIADGLIVSTPTGSTGYSLSAGGPIVCPELDCIMLTPICAHSLQHRPVVTSPTSRVTISLDDAHSSNALVSVDGRQACELKGASRLTVTRSPRQARFIRVEPRDFFAKIRYKLSEWSC